MFQRSTKNSTATDAPKPEAPSKKSPPTIISADVNLLGNVISEGAVDIDGKIEGNVRARTVTIRKNGKVRGDVFADEIVVYGEVRGTIKARQVSLYSSCHVEGVIMHEMLTIEDGAFVDGQFKRTDRAGSTPLLEHQPDENSDEYQMFRNLRLISA